MTGSEFWTLLPDPCPARPPSREDGGREQREEGGGTSRLPRAAHAGVAALVRRHGELRRRAGDAAPVLDQVRARTVLPLRLVPSIRELYARRTQVDREDGECQLPWPDRTSLCSPCTTWGPFSSRFWDEKLL